MHQRQKSNEARHQQDGRRRDEAGVEAVAGAAFQNHHPADHTRGGEEDAEGDQEFGEIENWGQCGHCGGVWLTGTGGPAKEPPTFNRRVRGCRSICLKSQVKSMKVRNSLKALLKRHRDNKLVRRHGRVYIINKTNPRYKARQG